MDVSANSHAQPILSDQPCQTKLSVWACMVLHAKQHDNRGQGCWSKRLMPKLLKLQLYAIALEVTCSHASSRIFPPEVAAAPAVANAHVSPIAPNPRKSVVTK